jgi:hypothetical protein
MFKVSHKSNMFMHVENTQTSRNDNLNVFSNDLVKTKCAPFLLKIGDGFNIDD